MNNPILLIRPTSLLLHQLLDFGDDRWAGVVSTAKTYTIISTLTLRIQTLEGNLLLQTTTAFPVRPHIGVLGG